uniref:Uncharacterized protein n=1 Tax=Arion vulgaris TaxID=1028688 RepID=A0A0B6Y8P3_9EUPU
MSCNTLDDMCFSYFQVFVTITFATNTHYFVTVGIINSVSHDEVYNYLMLPGCWSLMPSN